MTRKLNERDKQAKQKHINELQETLATVTDIKRRSFLQATINILENEIARGVGFVK